MPNPYKCQNHQTAMQLKYYWDSAYGIKCMVRDVAGYTEIRPDADYSVGKSAAAFELWRNICDAFVAGRASMAG